MKRLFILIELVLLIGLGYLLFVGMKAVPTIPQIKQIDLEYERESPNSDQKQSDQKPIVNAVSYCLKLEAIDLSDLPEVNQQLQRWRPSVQTQIVERYKDPRFLVYFGPLQTQTALKAFMKQFKQQGYAKAVPVFTGALSGGIVIDSFETEEEALKMHADMPNPMHGIRIVQQDDIPSDQVDVLVSGINEDQYLILKEVSEKTKKFSVNMCD